MTLDEFFTKLEQTPRDWQVTPMGTIRRVNQNKDSCRECPVCSLHKTHTLGAHVAAKDLGLHPVTANRIINAADDVGSNYPDLRERLLKACGLS